MGNTKRQVGKTMEAKADQKALVAEKQAEREALMAAGVNGPMKKAIAADTVICTVCGATEKGPKVKCECPGGRKKPTGEDDFITVLVPILVNAATARYQAEQAVKREEMTRNQAQVAGQREKHKAAKIGADAELEVVGDGGTEIMVAAEFPIGKLGMELYKIGVQSVSTASELGVKKGWVIAEVNGNMIGKDAGDGSAEAIKKLIQKEVVTCFKKEEKPCIMKFRTPIKEGDYCYCIQCDKFVEVTEYEEDQLALGAGKQLCGPCYEFGDIEAFE